MPANPNFAIYVDTNRTRIPLIAGVSGYPFEDHQFNLSLTHYPVESGSKLTDNAVREQTTIKLEGMVADLYPGFAPGEPQRVWDRIFRLIDSRTPVQVITRLRSYSNMMITKCTAPVSRESGRGLKFSIELTEILFANSQIVRFPPDSVSPTGPAAHRTSEVDGGDRSSPFLTPNISQQYGLLSATSPTPTVGADGTFAN